MLSTSMSEPIQEMRCYQDSRHLQDRRRSAGLAAVVPPISRAGRGIGATSAPQPAGLVLLPPAGRGGGRAVTAQPLDRFRQCHHAYSSRSDLTA